MRKSIITAIALGMAIIPGALAAQEYPARPISLIVPFAAGGGSDTIARLIAAELSHTIGANIIVENVGGGGTNIGNERVARSDPNGYTLLLAQVTLGINPALYPSLSYEVEAFEPVGMIALSRTIMVVQPDFPATTVAEFVEEGRASEEPFYFGSGGVGTSVHLSGELFGLLTGVEMEHIPYRGSGPAGIDLMGSALSVLFDTAPSVTGHVQVGAMRALAVTGETRFGPLPDVPTFAEAGLEGFDAPVWYGIVAPPGTPAEIVEYLNGHLNTALADSELAARYLQIGAEVAPMSPEEMRAFIGDEIEKWSRVVADAGVTLD